MTGISILQHVHQLLSNSPTLTKMVGKKIYPQIALENTTFPFIVLQRNTLYTEYVKDEKVMDKVTVSVNIAATTYKESVEIAEEVRKCIECKRMNGINEIRMESINEEFIEDTYLQQLVFTFQVLL